MRLERREPGRLPAGVLAVLVHLIFVAVLVFGVSWQSREAAPVVAELWSSLPAPVPKVEPKPEPKPEPEPEPRLEPKPVVKPEPKPEPKPVVKPEPKPEPRPVKADIKLKEKEKEKEKKRKEDERKKAEADKKLKEQELKEQRAQLEADRAAINKQREETEAARRQMAAQAAARDRAMADAISRISSHVRRFVVMPPDVVGNPEALFDVSLIPSGEVLDVKLSRSSGNPAYDNAVERAIRKASPLPLPTDPALIGRFRELKLKFRPNE